MAAGEHGRLLACWIYGGTPPLGAGDAKYKWGLGDKVIKRPNAMLRTEKRKAGNSALPNGYYTKKLEIWKEVFEIETMPIDAVPFYHGHGKAVANDDYDISLSPDGDVPDITIHLEDNHLSSDQAREWYEAKCIKCAVGFKENMLMVTNTYMPQREYDMSTDLVVRSTVAATRIGTNSAVKGYSSSNHNNEYVWELNAGNKDLSSLFKEFSYVVQPDIVPVPEDDGNDYAASIQNRSEWNPGMDEGIEVSFTFSMDDANTVIDDLRAMLGIGDVHANDAMTAKIYKNDTEYLKFSFENAILVGFRLSVEQASHVDGTPMIEAVFQQVQDITIAEKNDTTNPVGAYELT